MKQLRLVVLLSAFFLSTLTSGFARAKNHSITVSVAAQKPVLYYADVSLSMHLQECGEETCLKYMLESLRDYIVTIPDHRKLNVVFFGDSDGGIYSVFKEPTKLNAKTRREIVMTIDTISELYQEMVDNHNSTLRIKTKWINADILTWLYKDSKNFSKQNGTQTEDFKTILNFIDMNQYGAVCILSDFIYIPYTQFSNRLGFRDDMPLIISKLKGHRVYLQPFGRDPWSSDEKQYRAFVSKSKAVSFKRILPSMENQQPENEFARFAVNKIK